MYRVVFPFELKLCNTSEGCDAADSIYNLFAVVVHIGSGMNHGKPYQAGLKLCSLREFQAPCLHVQCPSTGHNQHTASDIQPNMSVVG